MKILYVIIAVLISLNVAGCKTGGSGPGDSSTPIKGGNITMSTLDKTQPEGSAPLPLSSSGTNDDGSSDSNEFDPVESDATTDDTSSDNEDEPIGSMPHNPEPATMALFASGLGIFALLKRKK